MLSSPAPSRRNNKNNSNNSNSNNNNNNTSTSTSSRNNQSIFRREQSLDDQEELESASNTSHRESSIISNPTNPTHPTGGLSGRNRYVDTTVRQPSYAYGAAPDPNELVKKRSRISSGSGSGNGSSRQDGVGGEDAQSPDLEVEASEPSSKVEPAKERYARRKAENAAKAASTGKPLSINGAAAGSGLISGGGRGSSAASVSTKASSSGGRGRVGASNGKRRAATGQSSKDRDFEGSDEEVGVPKSRIAGDGESMHHAFLRGPDEEEADTSGSMPTSLLRGAQRPSNYPMSPSMRSSEASDSRSYSREQQWADEDEARKNGPRLGQSSSNSWLGSLASSFGRSPKSASKPKRSNQDPNYRPSDQEDDEEQDDRGGVELEHEDLGNTSKNSNRTRRGRNSRDPTFRPDPNAQDSDSQESTGGKKNHKITRKVSSTRSARGGRDDNGIWREKRRKGRKGRKLGENGEEEEDGEEHEDEDEMEDDTTFGADGDLTPEIGHQTQQQDDQPRSKRSLSRKPSSRQNQVRSSRSGGWSIFQWTASAAAFLVLAFITTSFVGENSGNFSLRPSGGYVAPNLNPGTSEEVIGRLRAIEKFVQNLSASVADARSAGERADEASRDLGKRLAKLEKDSIEASRITKHLENRISESRAQSELRVKEIENKAVEMTKEVQTLRTELRQAQEKATEIAMNEKGKVKDSSSYDLESSKIDKRVDSLAKELAEANKQLKTLAAQAQRAQETADAAKSALEPLVKELPDQMPVRIDKKTGQLRIDPLFWTELKKVFSDQDRVSSLEKSVKKIGTSKDGEVVVQEPKELDWTSFRQANELALKSLFTEELDRSLEARLGSGALLSKSAFLDLLHVEMEKAKETLSEKFNENSEELQNGILAKVRIQNDLYQKSGSWGPGAGGGGRDVKSSASYDQQAQVALTSPTSREYEDAINDLSTLKTKKGDASTSIKTLIDAALELYSSDRIGKTDYALFSNGARVFSHGTSESYSAPLPGFLRKVLPGFLVEKTVTGRPPITAIHHDNAPGMCWAFSDLPGQLMIRLARRVLPSDITIEHVAKAIAFEEADSAPKTIRVWAHVDPKDLDSMKKLKNHHSQKVKELTSPRDIDDEDSLEIHHEEQRQSLIERYNDPQSKVYLLSTVDYDVHSSRPIQTFPISSEARSLGLPTSVVSVEILSNHGNKDYTCLYRFRLHGVPARED